MCDSLVALVPHTRTGSTILAKNSDREPDEAQAIVRIARKHPTEKHVKCTFIAIPQVRETYEVILSKPFQMWGAEMGVNEHGVAIANEAVFTRAPLRQRNTGLTGMDLLRVGLERSQTAREAVEVIAKLLEEFGQDACGGYKNRSFFYHNSFLISDPQWAFVLDTAGRSWAWKEVQGVQTISNALNITTDYEACTIVEKAKWLGVLEKEHEESFSDYYSDTLMTTFSRAKKRRTASLQAIRATTSGLDVASAMQILRSHHLGDAQYSPKKATTADLCMHATSFLNPNSTTGSMVACLRSTAPHTVWLTGTSHPCLSVYIPFFLRTTTLSDIALPSAKPDNSLWWRAKRVHDWIIADYRKRKSLVRQRQAQLQAELITEEAQLLGQAPGLDTLAAFSKSCLVRVEDWYAEIERRIGS